LAYRIREATLGDADVLVHHRIAMFTDMRVPLDRSTLEPAFREWLAAQLPAGAYRAWVAEDDAGAVVAGGGMTVVPWPPGPRYLGNRLGFVYNMYTEPSHRHRGLARRILEAMHAWARANGVGSMALNASAEGLELYEAMGYALSPNPMMFRQL
jgi:GNAT superfamily N-acetyltransferase